MCNTYCGTKIRTSFIVILTIMSVTSCGGGGSNPPVEESGILEGPGIPVSETGPVPDVISVDLDNVPLHTPFSLLNIPYSFNGVNINPDGRLIGRARLESSETVRNFSVELSTSEVTLLTPNNILDGEFSYSRNSVVYTNDGALYSIDSVNPVKISGTEQVSKFWLSADQTKVLYIANESYVQEINPDTGLLQYYERNELYIVDVTGRNRHKIGLSDPKSLILTERNPPIIESHLIRPQLTPDLSRVIYVVKVEATGMVELHSARADGTADTVLNDSVISAVQVDENELSENFVFTIAPDSSRVVYGVIIDTVMELYSVAPNGSGNVKISGALASGVSDKGQVINGTVLNSLSPFVLNITQDSSRVLFLANKDDVTVVELYSVALNGDGLVKISNGQAVSAFTSTNLSGLNTVIYAGTDVYSVAVSGGASTQLSSGLSLGRITMPTLSSDNSSVVYLLTDSITNQTRLFASRLDASSTSDLSGAMDGELNGSGNVPFMLDPLSDNVVYRVNEAGYDYALYTVKLDATGRQKITPDRLHPQYTSSAMFGFYQNKFYFRYDKDTWTTTELYAFDFSINVTENISASWSPFVSEDISYLVGQSDAGDVQAFTTEGVAYSDVALQVINNGSECRVLAPVDGRFIDTPLNIFLSPTGNDLYYTITGINDWEFHKVNTSDCSLTVIDDGATNILQRMRITPDEANVVYTTRTGDLIAAASDGTGTHLLNGNRALGGLPSVNNGAFTVTPDSTQVVYWADQNTSGVTELYAVTIDGLTTNKINAPLVTGGQVFTSGSIFPFKLTDDNQWVVYLAQQDSLTYQVYKSNLDGSQNTIISDGLVNASLYFTSTIDPLRITNDSSKVVYLTRDNTTQAVGFHAANLTGAALPVQLTQAFAVGGGISLSSGRSLLLSADSTKVVYVARESQISAEELYVVNLDGTGRVKLNVDISGDGNVDGFSLSSDSQKVVYSSNANSEAITGLYVSNVDGTAKTLLVDDILRIQRYNYERPRLTSDGRVVFRAKLNGVDGIYIMPISGGAAILVVEIPEDRQIDNVTILNDNQISVQGDLRKLGVEELFQFSI